MNWLIFFASVASCAVPVGNVSLMLFQEGRSSNLRLRRGLRQAAQTRNNPHIQCNGVYCAWILNNAVSSEMYWVQFSGSWVPSLTLTLIVHLHTKLPVTGRDILQNATGAQGSYSCIHDPTHCSRHKHLARPHTNKKKWKETIFIPRPVCLLRNKNVNKEYELEKGEDSAQWNKLMTYIQYVTQSCRKKNNVYQPWNRNIHQICNISYI
jgi:hypothetical protein